MVVQFCYYKIIMHPATNSNDISAMLHAKWTANSAIAKFPVVRLNDEGMNVVGCRINKKAKSWQVLIPLDDEKGINKTLEMAAILDVGEVAANQNSEAE